MVSSWSQSESEIYEFIKTNRSTIQHIEKMDGINENIEQIKSKLKLTEQFSQQSYRF